MRATSRHISKRASVRGQKGCLLTQTTLPLVQRFKIGRARPCALCIVPRATLFGKACCQGFALSPSFSKERLCLPFPRNCPGFCTCMCGNATLLPAQLLSQFQCLLLMIWRWAGHLFCVTSTINFNFPPISVLPVRYDLSGFLAHVFLTFHQAALPPFSKGGVAAFSKAVALLAFPKAALRPGHPATWSCPGHRGGRGRFLSQGFLFQGLQGHNLCSLWAAKHFWEATLVE